MLTNAVTKSDRILDRPPQTSETASGVFGAIMSPCSYSPTPCRKLLLLVIGEVFQETGFGYWNVNHSGHGGGQE
jgi:hypothetical protein